MDIKSVVNGKNVVVTATFSQGDGLVNGEAMYVSKTFIKGVMKSEIKNNQIEFYCDECVSLGERLKTPMSKVQFLLLVQQFVAITRNIKLLNLNPDKLLLDFRYVFINEANWEVQLAYLPCVAKANGNTLASFLDAVSQMLKPFREADMGYMQRFSAFIKSVGSFEPDTVEKYVSQEDPKVVAAVTKSHPAKNVISNNRADNQPVIKKAEPVAPVDELEGTALMDEEDEAPVVAKPVPVAQPVSVEDSEPDDTALMVEEAPVAVKPEPAIKPETQPVAQPTPAPVRPAPQPVVQPTPAPVRPAPKPVAQPVPAPVRPTPQPTAQPVRENEIPAYLLASQGKKAPQPVVQPTPAPVTPVPQPVAQPTPAPARPAPQPVAQPTPAPVTPAPQPVVQPTPAPVTPAPQPVAQPIAAPDYNDDKTGILNEPFEPMDKIGRTPVVNNVGIKYPTLKRVFNGEITEINKPVFRIGKEKSYVDYFIRNSGVISRSHADIITRDNKYYIMDLNSKNKTYINGRMILPNCEFEIFDGDTITLANEDFLFKV